ACCTWYTLVPYGTVGLLGLIRTDTVSAYQRTRLFVWANSMKIVDSDTYQEIPDTGHF
ncbi:hypothetical protein BE221DRAFT_63701, partial [Ostreococcus tauri]